MTDADLRLVQARWTLGQVASEEIPRIACEALAAGFESPAFRILGGESKPVMSEVAPLLDRAFAEIGCQPMELDTAALVVARHCARRVVSGEVAPFDGARAIWSEVCELLGDVDPWFAFKRLASEHEDYRFAAQSTPAGTYDDKIRECEEGIVRAASRLIS